MTKRNKVRRFEQIRKAHAKFENPSVRDLSRTFKVHRRLEREALTSAVQAALGGCHVLPLRPVVPKLSPRSPLFRDGHQDNRDQHDHDADQLDCAQPLLQYHHPDERGDGTVLTRQDGGLRDTVAR